MSVTTFDTDSTSAPEHMAWDEQLMDLRAQLCEVREQITNHFNTLTHEHICRLDEEEEDLVLQIDKREEEIMTKMRQKNAKTD